MKKIQYICKPPGPKSTKIIARDNAVVSPSVTREYSFVFEKAKDCFVWDADGDKYLDFASGIAVANVGHSNPFVVKAIKQQLNKAIHCGFSDFYAELPVEFAESLLSFLPNYLDNLFFSNSGTESIEAAYKLAKWHSNKKYTIAFFNAFHGRTMGSLSMTCSKPVQRERFGPFLPVKHCHYAYCYRCAFGKSYGECSFECLSALEKTMKSLKGNLASVFIEPIQGEGGYIVPPKEFLAGVRKLCNEFDALLCADEVQSGSMRTGNFLAMQSFRVKPDIVSIAKGIGGGMPIGVTVANHKIMDWPSGSHANTFGGNLLSCAAGKAVLEFFRKKKIGNNVKKQGKHLLKRLNEMKEEIEIIGDVRGKGLMAGAELVEDKKSKKPLIKGIQQVLCNASANGLIMLPCGRNTIRFAPPLIISREQLDFGLDVFEQAVKAVKV